MEKEELCYLSLLLQHWNVKAATLQPQRRGADTSDHMCTLGKACDRLLLQQQLLLLFLLFCYNTFQD
jgi:hypothetical protein